MSRRHYGGLAVAILIWSALVPLSGLKAQEAVAPPPLNPDDPVLTIQWTLLPGSARDLSITGDAQAYAISTNGTALRWRAELQRWGQMSGTTFERITGAEGNRPWAITPEGVAMRFNGLWWEAKEEAVADVAGDEVGNVYIALRNGGIRRWEPLSGSWKSVPGTARRIALDIGGRLWIVDTIGRIARRNGNSWQAMPGLARDIAIGGDGTAAIVDADGEVRVWQPNIGRWVRLGDLPAKASVVAVTPNGGPWMATADGTIFASDLIRTDTAAIEERDTASAPQAPTASALQAPTAQAPAVKAPGAIAPSITTSAPAATQPTAQSDSAPEAKATTPTASKVTAATSSTSGKKTPSVSPGKGGGSTDPVTVTSDQPLNFTNTRETAERLAIGADGSVFALAGGGLIKRWNNTHTRFEDFPGQLVRLAVAPSGNPWGVSSFGRVFRHDGQNWQQIVGATASDISVGVDGTVISSDAESNLARLNPATGRFERISGRGLQVAVAPDGTPWTIRDDNFVQHCDTDPCTAFPLQARNIAIGPDGSVFLISVNGQLLRRLPQEKDFARVLVPGFTPANVAVGPRGLPWVVATDGTVLASAFFERDESADRVVALATQTGTTGSGATAPVVSSQSSSAFTFTKNLKFKRYQSTEPDASFAALDDIHIGHTGSVFIRGNNGIFKFNEKKEKFEALDTKFSVSLTDMDEDADGVLWGLSAVAPATVYRIKGTQTKSYSISDTSGTPRSLVVDGDGTVYVVVANSIYRKKPNASIFQQYTTSSDVKTVVVGLPGDVWILSTDSQVQQYTGTRFENRPLGQNTEATDIGAGPDGSLYIIDNNSFLPKKWNATNKKFDDINTTIQMNKVDVTDEGRPWFAITSFAATDGDILRSKD